MGATNHTTNYNLSQFVGTDKPAWLQDYNGDMTKIDAGIHLAKQAADAAQLDATQAGNAAAANASAITSLQTNVGSLQTAVGTNTGNINTINSLIGNGTPTTTDQTIIGAINELNSGKANKHVLAYSVDGDGVTTLGALLKDLYDNIDPSKITYNSKFVHVAPGGINTIYNLNLLFGDRIGFSIASSSATSISSQGAVISSDLSHCSYSASSVNTNGFTGSESAALASESGHTFAVYY